MMVEQQGAALSQTVSQPSSPAEPSQANSAGDQQERKSTSPPPQADHGAELIPKIENNAATKSAAQIQPTALPFRPTPKVPVFDLTGTDSDTNAMVLSGQILPASPDDKFRNRLPSYPVQAAIRGERGSVLVVIHVSPYGLATGAEVAESSGHGLLDQAALKAVLKWHFLPAMKNGRSIQFDTTFRFDFEPF